MAVVIAVLAVVCAGSFAGGIWFETRGKPNGDWLFGVSVAAFVGLSVLALIGAR